jgi:hypothetical protein
MATTQRAPDRPPDLTLFTLVHRAMRRDAARLSAAVAGLGDGDRARAGSLRRWYRAYRAELIGHHSLEDQIWFPVLAERVPTFGEHSDRIDREHHQLADALTAVGVALDHLADADAGGAPTAIAPARDATRELVDLVDGHLGFEDADILPLYLRHFTQDEYAEVERRARKMLDKRHAPFAVPWILSAATPGERTRVLGQAPVAFKLLWYASRRRHARNSARALGAGEAQEVA